MKRLSRSSGCFAVNSESGSADHLALGFADLTCEAPAYPPLRKVYRARLPVNVFKFLECASDTEVARVAGVRGLHDLGPREQWPSPSCEANRWNRGSYIGASPKLSSEIPQRILFASQVESNIREDGCLFREGSTVDIVPVVV